MEEVKKGGGRVSSNVTSKTTHLLTGTGAGSKLEKAHSLGVRIVSEEEFLEMLIKKKNRQFFLKIDFSLSHYMRNNLD